jgi:hypothetical protein
VGGMIVVIAVLVTFFPSCSKEKNTCTDAGEFDSAPKRKDRLARDDVSIPATSGLIFPHGIPHPRTLLRCLS